MYVSKNSPAGQKVLADMRRRALRADDLPTLRSEARVGELVVIHVSSQKTGSSHIILEDPEDIEAFFDFISRYAA